MARERYFDHAEKRQLLIEIHVVERKGADPVEQQWMIFGVADARQGEKGRKGDITRVLPKEGKAIVSGVNVAIRHQRPSAQGQGGRVALEGGQHVRVREQNNVPGDTRHAGEGDAVRVGFAPQAARVLTD